MQKTILITGSTDGIGLETAKTLVSQGHRVLIHGRNPKKLDDTKNSLKRLSNNAHVESYLADLSQMDEVKKLARAITENHDKLDVIINNAGIYKTLEPITEEGLDTRFVVNTLAPYLLTQELLPLLSESSRVINLSSAAQASVNLNALEGKIKIADDFNAYAQSKLAITIWTRYMAQHRNSNGPTFIAVNPGSLLATKMVKEGFGMAGNDIHKGSDILTQLALDERYSSANGKYFDNDIGSFSEPHHEALDNDKCISLMKIMNNYVRSLPASL